MYWAFIKPRQEVCTNIFKVCIIEGTIGIVGWNEFHGMDDHYWNTRFFLWDEKLEFLFHITGIEFCTIKTHLWKKFLSDINFSTIDSNMVLVLVPLWFFSYTNVIKMICTNFRLIDVSIIEMSSIYFWTVNIYVHLYCTAEWLYDK